MHLLACQTWWQDFKISTAVTVENPAVYYGRVLVNPLFSVACTPKAIASFIITNYKFYKNE